jgi:hypothetical protein
MKRLLLILNLLAGCQLSLLAGDYPVSAIAPELLKNANAVLRFEEIRFEVINNGKAVYKNHYVITILNESGENWAECSEYYDKSRKIRSVEGILYDARGVAIKKMKTRDMEDLSGVSDGTLIDDSRIKRHNFYYRVFPYTIEYDIELEYNSTLFFPSWFPQGGEKLSVEKSSLSVVCPPGYNFRYRAFNYDKGPSVTSEKNNKISSWNVSSIPAILRENYSPLWHELTPGVILGPTDFEVDDYKGNMVNWQDFGKFVHSLKAGKDVLPEHIKLKVRQLVAGKTNVKEQIAAVYEYLQKNTRYISIQLGIGGWQPFDANFVAAKAYGDCKALTNYMYSMLKEVGINSYYTLIRAGVNGGYITSDFPSQQFNHVILCVPVEKDTVWLECTSQTMPSGYLGDWTCDRFALLVDENGGRLIRTPKYGLNDNLQHRSVNAVLASDGTLTLDAATRYGGLEQDDLHGLIHGLSKDKVKKYLQEQLDFATYEINQFEYTENRDALPAIDEKLEITVSNYATVTGKRIFIVPNMMTRSYRKLTHDDDRKFDVVLNREFKKVDSVKIVLPAGFETESMPQDINIVGKFGKYSSAVELKGNILHYQRTIEQFSGRFPPADFNELVKFYEAIYKADRNRVVLVKKEQ